MSKKSTPTAPAAPDPTATANAQAQANTSAAITQANLNRINQITPQGSLSYTQTGTNSDGTPAYTQTQSYSPVEQQKYDQENQIALALGGLATDNISRVQQAQATPFSYDGMTPLQTGVSAGAIQNSIAPAGNVQTSYNSGGSIQNTIAPSGQVQTGLNFGSAFNPGDFNSSATNAANSAYAAATARLDPQYAQQESDLKSSLANQGISENSDAYRRAMDNFSRAKTDAYGQAQNNAYGQGLAAQQQGYSQALGTRQQNTSETTTAGNFANSAQAQIFGQNLQALTANNAAQAQQNQQNADAAAFGNSAQAQQYSQNANNATFANTAQNQQFNQAGANASLNNSARQQQIQEAAYLRNLPLNDIATLLGTGGTATSPTFSSVSQVGVAAPDYQGAVYANYNAANQQYQAAQQAKSQGLGSLFGLAGNLATTFI